MVEGEKVKRKAPVNDLFRGLGPPVGEGPESASLSCSTVPMTNHWKINQNPMLSQEYCTRAGGNFGLPGLPIGDLDRSCDPILNLKTSPVVVASIAHPIAIGSRTELAHG